MPDFDCGTTCSFMTYSIVIDIGIAMALFFYYNEIKQKFGKIIEFQRSKTINSTIFTKNPDNSAFY